MGRSCPLLQYAEDTLILLRADLEDVAILRTLLDQFSKATGLLVNFTKSTVVPMHVDDTDICQCSSWAAWVHRHANIATLDGDLVGTHWDALRALLPLYRAITTVQIGDGCTTAFWFDVWCGEDCLADKFLALLSHCKHTGQTVADVRERGLEQYLVPRLSIRAREELGMVRDILEHVPRHDCDDKRICPYSAPDGKLRTGPLYKLLLAAPGSDDPMAQFVWKNSVPPRVQLLVHDRVQCCSNLLRKKVIDDARCEVCGCDTETAIHIILECPFAKAFWRSLGFRGPEGLKTATLNSIPRPDNIPSQHFSTFVLLCCWHLRKGGMESSFGKTT
ncbi:uncharacterized protein [Setaria viridis]|uniref:uncharacterized protein n=1 Tax=Setaria viridis TaxID=4556 RepID=UPI0014939869|nr:uncharacterized protein LOC117861952 [Setaria viridis]